MLIARRLSPAGSDRLAERCLIKEGGLTATPERLLELAPGVAAIVADPAVSVGGRLLGAAGDQLRVVANFGAGHDNVDLELCRRRGVIVTNTPDVDTNATAELALSLTLAAARRTTEAEADLRAGRWRGSDAGAYLGLELSGATFGIVGMGQVGHRYAELVAALAGEILYTSRARKVAAEAGLGVVGVELDELLRRADVISLHLPPTPRTTGLIGRRELETMKSEAILINTASGSLVDAGDLAWALHDREISAAGLDVRERVPDELLRAPHCVLLPHIGSATSRARNAMAGMVADNVLAALQGDEPPNRLA